MLSAAQASGLSETWKWIIIVTCCLVVFLTGAMTLIVHIIETAFARIFGELVELGIEHVAHDIFGFDVRCGSVQVGVLAGSILINDLEIANPPGWKSDYFMKADTVHIHLHLWRYVWTHMFNDIDEFELDKVHIRDANMNIEESMWSSNIHDILSIVRQHKTKPENKSTRKSLEVKKEGNLRLHLHAVEITDTGATVPLLGRIVVPTISYKDFDSETEGKARLPRAIMIKIIEDLCMKLITNKIFKSSKPGTARTKGCYAVCGQTCGA